MKRILKLLARLYPAEWRARYGTEYEALLEEGTPRWGDAVDVAWGAVQMQITSWNFVRIVLPCAVAGMAAAALVSFIVPPQYGSQATILMQAGVAGVYSGMCGNQADLPDGLRGPSPGLCVYQEDFDQYKKFLAEGGFSREFLGSVIVEKDLYPRERRDGSLDAAVDAMEKNIHVRSTTDKSRLALEFDYPDPHVAQRVADELASQMIVQVQNAGFAKFLEKNGKDLRERMTFLQKQLPLAKNAEEASEVRVQIRQTQDAQSVAARWRPLTLESVRLRLASLPQRPDGLSRTEMEIAGLFGGLLCGLSLAAARIRLRARRER